MRRTDSLEKTWLNDWTELILHFSLWSILSRFFYKMWKSCCCCSATQSCQTLCDPLDCSTLGVPVIHHLPELAQTHVHWVGDATQPSHPLLSPSPPDFNLSQHQGLFQWVRSLHQVAKVLELQLLVLLMPTLEVFEHYFASVWNECSCVVVSAFFGIAFLWDWNENWHFPIL